MENLPMAGNRTGEEIRAELAELREQYNEKLKMRGIEPQSIEPPAHLNDKAVQHWRALVFKVIEAGFDDSAFDALACYCVAWARWEAAEETLRAEGEITKAPSGYPMQNPALSISNKALTMMLKYGKVLGLPY